MVYSKPETCGPIFWNLGVLFATGQAMDHPAVLRNHKVWRDRCKLVQLMTENMAIANGRGFGLNRITDVHTQNGTLTGKGSRIPSWIDLDPDSWPAQEYIRRILIRRRELNRSDVIGCITLGDQFRLLSTVPGWASSTDDGYLIRVFKEATQHLVQLQFFGVDAGLVSTSTLINLVSFMFAPCPYQ